MFLEISFNYIIKYLIFSTVFSRVHSGFDKLRKFFLSLNYTDNFVELFNNISVCADIQSTWELVNICATEMEKDFFLCVYKDSFVEACREIIIEKMILLGSKIDLKYFIILYSITLFCFTFYFLFLFLYFV